MGDRKGRDEKESDMSSTEEAGKKGMESPVFRYFKIISHLMLFLFFSILLFVYFSSNSQIEFLQKSQKISFCFLFIFQMKFCFISYRLEIQKRERKEIPHSVEKTKQSALINVFISGFLLLYFFLKFSFYKV